MSGFKFFSEEDEDDKAFLAGKVQIMTMHKSKGDEFNLVFLPEMTEKKSSAYNRFNKSEVIRIYGIC